MRSRLFFKKSGAIIFNYATFSEMLKKASHYISYSSGKALRSVNRLIEDYSCNSRPFRESGNLWAEWKVQVMQGVKSYFFVIVRKWSTLRNLIYCLGHTDDLSVAAPDWHAQERFCLVPSELVDLIIESSVLKRSQRRRSLQGPGGERRRGNVSPYVTGKGPPAPSFYSQ